MKQVAVYILAVIVVVGDMILIYDVALWLPRKLGQPRRMGLVTRFFWWIANRYLPGLFPDDFGEFRSKTWRRERGLTP